MKAEKEKFPVPQQGKQGAQRGQGSLGPRWAAWSRWDTKSQAWVCGFDSNRGVFRSGCCCRQHISWVTLRSWLRCPAHPCGMGQGPLLLQVCGAAENRAHCPRALLESESACNILLELISLTRRLEWLNIAAAGNWFWTSAGQALVLAAAAWQRLFLFSAWDVAESSGMV